MLEAKAQIVVDTEMQWKVSEALREKSKRTSQIQSY